jgi:hypothetical protein
MSELKPIVLLPLPAGHVLRKDIDYRKDSDGWIIRVSSSAGLEVIHPCYTTPEHWPADLLCPWRTLTVKPVEPMKPRTIEDEVDEPQPSPANEIQQLRDQCKRQAATINGLQKMIDVKTTVIESQDKMIESWRRCYNDMRTDRDNLAAERNKLRDEVTERQRSHNALIDLYEQRGNELHNTARRLGEAQERIEWLEKELQELQQQCKPLKWERRLPTADECYTCFIIEKRKNGIIMGYGPKETSATSWGEDAEFVCVIPTILPAIEIPQPVIERLWILENADTVQIYDWVAEGERPIEALAGEWKETDTTRERKS